MANKRRNLRCRLQLREDCPDFHLVNYLQDRKIQEKNELILKAIKAFWLPVAVESAPDYSYLQVVTFYLDAIEQLKSQIWYLQQQLLINHEVEVEPLNLVSERKVKTHYSSLPEECEVKPAPEGEVKPDSESESKIEDSRHKFGF